MAIERFTPENTTIMMIDYSVGFINTFRSHTVDEHLKATVALAKIGRGFNTGFVVNLGAGQTPYPQLVQTIGDQPVIMRGGEYNALENPDVLDAVKKTGRDHLVMAGLTTEGCLLYTALGALQLGYTVALVEDATAGATLEAHQMALQRMVQAGVVPTTWLSLATELQYDWSQGDTAKVYFDLIAENEPGLMLAVQSEHSTPS
jgi:nicotinamidase-related amidase